MDISDQKQTQIFGDLIITQHFKNTELIFFHSSFGFNSSSTELGCRHCSPDLKVFFQFLLMNILTTFLGILQSVA